MCINRKREPICYRYRSNRMSSRCLVSFFCCVLEISAASCSCFRKRSRSSEAMISCFLRVVVLVCIHGSGVYSGRALPRAFMSVCSRVFVSACTCIKRKIKSVSYTYRTASISPHLTHQITFGWLPFLALKGDLLMTVEVSAGGVFIITLSPIFHWSYRSF